MADAEARFVIAIDPAQGVAGGNAVGSALERLKAKISEGTKALQELQGAAGRLRAAGEVVRFEDLGKDLKRAQADADKLESKLAGLRSKLEGTTNIKAGQALKSQIAETEKGLGAAKDRVSAIAGAREKLGQSEAVKAYKDVTAAIKDKQAALAGAQTEVSRLGGSLTQSAESSQEAAGATGLLSGKLEQLKGMGAAGVVVAIAAALVGLAVAAGRAAYSLGAFIIGLSDAARTAQIFRDATARSAEGGAALAESINRVYQRVGGARGEVEQLALELRRLGLEGQALESSLEAVRSTARIFGPQAGSAIQGLIDRAALVRRGVLQPLELRGTGLAFADVARAVANNFKISMGAASQALRNGQLKVEDFTRALRDAARVRTGDALAKLALSLPEQMERAHENIAAIFKLDPSKFLGGLHSILSLLDESTETGKQLRALAKTIFQPLLDSSEKIFPILRAFMLGMIAVGIELAIVLVDLAIAVRRILPADVLGKFDAVKVAFYAGGIAAGILTLSFLGLAVATGLLIAGMLLLASPILVIGAALAALFVSIASTVNDVLDYFAGDAPMDAGESLVDGIIQGIKSRASALFSEIASLATGGLLSFNAAAKIRSPSRVFQASGEQIAAGVAVGVEDGQARVSQAVAGLASTAPLEDASAQVGGGARSARGGVYIERIEVNASRSSPDDVRDNRALLQALIEVFEMASRSAGLGVVTVGATVGV